MKNTKMPAIRFKGFNDDWEQRKLGELYQRNTERNENLIGYDKTISVATMSYKDDGNGASESSLSTYKVLRVGDIAFEGHTNKQFRFGRFVVNDIGTGIMSPRFSTLRPLNEMPVNFWKQYIHSESVMRRILVNSTKAGTMMNELVIPEFLNQTIMVPSENEQAVIGQYFSNLDHLITLHQRKLEKIKLMKKSMLGKMFSRDAESIPKIRFDGYTDDWEQRKLKDFVDKAVDNRGKTPPLDENGTHPLIEVAALGGGHPDYSKIEKYLNDDSFENNLRAYIKEGDILFTTVGSIGLVSLMDSREDAAIAQNIVAFRAKENFIPEYLYALFSNEDNQYKATRIVMGAVQPSIKVSQLVDVEYMLSTKEAEQKKIGTYFSNIDYLITLHQRKLEKLKKVKKSLLEHMFPMEK